jgi:hypothetical protein
MSSSTDEWSPAGAVGGDSGDRSDRSGHDPEVWTGAPALEGPFVSVAPGVWVRASRVSAVARAAAADDAGDRDDRGGSRVYVLGAAAARPRGRPACAGGPRRGVFAFGIV